jgi:aromatic ring-opening dioxygenase catalytic subunit (LigB family)
MKDFPYKEIKGDGGFARHIAQTAMQEDFEPSLSHRLKLDHGFCIPLWRMELGKLPRIVPMIVNSIEPPLPSIGRCLQWGKLLKKTIESYSEPLRVAILATGGLSHSIGERTMGAIDEELDRECIRRFSSPEKELLKFLEKKLPAAGNGTEEIRNWLVAHGAAGGRGFELVDYLPVPTVLVGCGFASWTIPAGRRRAAPARRKPSAPTARTS